LMPEAYDPEAPPPESVVSYTRDVSYYTLCGMKDMIKCTHKLYNLKVDMFDQLYLLKIIDYGELQRSYKKFNQFGNN